MKQSLLAFLAMSIFSLLALSQQRVVMKYHGMIYGRDYELAAMNMVSEKLSEIRALAFDEADLTASSPGQRRATDDLTTAKSLGLDGGETDITFADDIDDYHQYSQLAELHEFNGLPYAFDWFVTVCYVDEYNLGSGCTTNQTLAKEITITLKETLPLDPLERKKMDLGRPPIQVTIKRVLSPGGLEFH